MKTIEINVYEFHELNEKAKKVAIEQNRSWVGDTQAEIDGDAFHWTLEKMGDVLGVCIREEDFGWVLGVYGERWEEVMDDPKYLARYLNWVDDRVAQFKSYYLEDQSRWTRRHISIPKRVSNITYKDYDWCLTGEWTDATFDDFMKRRWGFIRDGLTISQFIDELLDKFRRAWDEDIEYGYSDENVLEIIYANDYFSFLEDGRWFRTED